MADYYYFMLGDAPAPSGGGDLRTWFEFYKLGAGGETFVPLKHEDKLPNIGDFLWFVLDDHVVAMAPVLRVVEDPINVLHEAWFDSTRARQLSAPVPFDGFQPDHYP